MARLVVTRPAGQERSLCDTLTRLGHDVVHMPLMAIEPVSLDQPALRQCLLDLDCYHKVISISANATRLGLEAVDEFWPQMPVGIEWFAVGPTSAEALIQSGLSTTVPDERYDSEGLLALPGLQQIEHEKILIWRGIGGREVLANSLRQRGAQVSYAELYHRVEQTYPASVWDQSLNRDTWLLLSSGQALDIVEQQVADLSSRIAGLVLPSERVAAVARHNNYRKVLVPASARDEDVVACLASATTD